MRISEKSDFLPDLNAAEAIDYALEHDEANFDEKRDLVQDRVDRILNGERYYTVTVDQDVISDSKQRVDENEFYRVFGRLHLALRNSDAAIVNVDEDWADIGIIGNAEELQEEYSLLDEYAEIDEGLPEYTGFEK